MHTSLTSIPDKEEVAFWHSGQLRLLVSEYQIAVWCLDDKLRFWSMLCVKSKDCYAVLSVCESLDVMFELVRIG